MTTSRDRKAARTAYRQAVSLDSSANVAFCGLPWDDACLHHEKNPQAVATPSLWQVRQPVYRSSMERWRNYEPWLRAFADLRG